MTDKQYDLIVIGDLNYDYLGNIPRFPQADDEVEISPMQCFLGGSGANASVVATRLGLKVAFFSAVGVDISGDALLQLLEQENVSTQFIQRAAELNTGLCFGMISDNGERRLFAYRGANLALKSEEIQNSFLRSARRLHLNGPLFSNALDLMPRAHAAGIPTSIDPGSILIEQHRYDLEVLYPHTDVLFLNQVELRALTDADYEEKCIEELLLKGVQNVVIKSGENGSALWRAGQPVVTYPAFQINALDTTGAGDAFNAAFLYAIIQNYSFIEILKFANAVGAMAASAVGATTGAPQSAQQVFHFIQNTPVKTNSK